ncbi:MAG: MobA/MobL family protein [Lachnospiraceae bacterium]|nr:MobA/MobL family protein [Lachnospiraceae bacterium]
MSKLHNVRGRITYISSHAKQENLYAVYETTDRPYWTELARYNQQEFLKSGTEGKCIEARELIIALPESFPDLYYPDKLLQLFTNRFKEKYGVECVSALHHNKRKTNYHIHLIFSERELLPKPIEKIATRNMFYNEQGKHVRTKKEILDDSGNVLKGCKIIKKDEVYERIPFTFKNPMFKQEAFVDEAKRFYTDIINRLIEDEKDKLHVFDKNGLYLATKKIGKNNPKAEQIKADNEVRMQWNHEVDRALVSQVPEDEIRQIKKEFITDRIRQSIDAWGRQPDMLANIIIHAAMRLALLISKVLTAARELKNKLFHETLEKEYGTPATVKEETIITVDTTLVTEVAKEPEPQIPPRPVMPSEAAAFPKLKKIKVTLDNHNNLIFEAERERSELEIELSDLKGLARLTKKKELESKISFKTKEIQTLKAGLSGIVRQHGFATVQDFYKAFYTVQNAFDTYQKACAKWEKAFGEQTTPKAETMHEKIQRYQEKADRQNANRPYQSRDKGGR